MSRPQIHPRTKMFWLRKRVPADLVVTLGRKEVTLSLQTKDPTEAKKRYAEELRKLEQRWTALRAGSRSLTEVEAHGLAQEVHDWWLEMHRANPSEQRFWRTDLAEKLWVPPPLASAEAILDDLLNGPINLEFQSIGEMESWCGQTVACPYPVVQVRS